MPQISAGFSRWAVAIGQKSFFPAAYSVAAAVESRVPSQPWDNQQSRQPEIYSIPGVRQFRPGNYPLPSAHSPAKSVRKATGLCYWMTRVLDECDRVAVDFSADPVHDLRVALRRCRSMADGLMAIAPDPDWKKMKKAGKSLFQRLGDLRDIQIMKEWLEKLDPNHPATAADARVARALPPAASELALSLPKGQVLPASTHPLESNAAAANSATGAGTLSEQAARDPVSHALLEILAHREVDQKHEAQAALEEFDRKQWRQWSKSLPLRAARFRVGSPLFKHLALERWTAAHELHTRALRNRSGVALHALRIGIKRFRYIVENFLPEEHKAWSGDLKQIQDLLGEVHDLDVLWATALSCLVFPDPDSRKLWHARILKERTRRVDLYRKKMTGPNSPWHLWRTALPQGRQIQAIATRRMKLWAQALDPDFAHSEHVAKLALELYDGLTAMRLLGPTNGAGMRSSLQIAALLHDVGKSKGNKGHHKASLELIQSHGAPLGWKPEDIRRAAIVARFHCGALPTRSHKALRDLLPDELKTTIQLAAILRLANALDTGHGGHIRHIRVEQNMRDHGSKLSCVTVAADGYAVRSATARAVAAERYLLETILRRPLMVKPSRLFTQRNRV